jgi:hypothetical protein
MTLSSAFKKRYQKFANQKVAFGDAVMMSVSAVVPWYVQRLRDSF